MYTLKTPQRSLVSIPTILYKINEIINFGIFKENIENLIEICKKLDLYRTNQYFYNIISDIDQKTMYEYLLIDDIYVIENLNILKSFLNSM
jgi:hypothetical protein